MNILIKNNFYSAFTSIGFIIGKLKEDLTALEFNNDKINEVFVIIDEWVSNIIKYAYKKDKNRQFYFEAFILDDNETLVLKFEDEGEPFNPLDYNKVPDYNVPIEDLPIGGLGIKFIKEVSDSVEYELTANKKNILTVKKNIK